MLSSTLALKALITFVLIVLRWVATAYANI